MTGASNRFLLGEGTTERGKRGTTLCSTTVSLTLAINSLASLPLTQPRLVEELHFAPLQGIILAYFHCLGGFLPKKAATTKDAANGTFSVD